ncbi:GRF1-interacting factor 2 [Canna indica]|uniref:GRF1-interacting factor 2 n=1 Tax=Canna indica TaxID=4628 RepID=A0AAQ3KDU6_9LILI|nr:GRF1-interacting factor 2 [Canna indica]
MQQPTHPLNPMSTIPIGNITTEQIQKYLDENKQLILAILENQNLGKLAECAQYQAQLQKNLLYLAAIADAQPNAPGVRPQMMQHGMLPQGGHFMQQPPVFPPRAPPQFNPQQMVFPGHMGIRPGAVNGMHNAPNPHATPNLAEFQQTGIASGAAVGHGSKHDAGAPDTATADSHRSSETEHGSGDADQSRAKRPEDGKTP